MLLYNLATHSEHRIMVVAIQYVCIPNQLIDTYSSIKVKKEKKKERRRNR